MENEIENFKLIVHIGTGKAGSTSIQQTLNQQQALLNEHKVMYCGLMFEHARSLFPWQRIDGWVHFSKLNKAIAQKQLREVLLTTIAELTKRGFHTAIWSNETIFINSEVVIATLEEIAQMGADIAAIAYIRRHDAWARSAYLQWGIRHKTYRGKVKSFKDWYADNPVEFGENLKPWLNQPWLEMSVRNFDACDDVVADFLQCVELESVGIEPVRSHSTPSPVSLALWSLFNSQFEGVVSPVELNALLGNSGVLSTSFVDCDFNSLIPTLELLEEVKEESAADRQFLNDVFEASNQPEISTSSLKNKDMQVTDRQIHAALLMIVRYQTQCINQLNSRLKKLEEQ